MLLHEEYGVNGAPLNPRLVETGLFKSEFAFADHAIKRLPRRTRHHLLNIGVGIEVEVERAAPISTRSKYWITEGDNSLRNTGLEFKTKYGVRLYELPTALRELSDHMESLRKAKNNEWFEFSERTSVHVHLDVRSLMSEQVENIIKLYTLSETPLFNFAGPDRKDNIFCVPLRESTILGEGHDLESYLRIWDKYCALNAKTIKTFGTIEFRHMKGNMDPEYIFNWCCLLGLLQTRGLYSNQLELDESIRELKMSSQYQQMMEQTFFGFADLLRYDVSDFDAAVSDSKLMFDTKGS